MMNMNNVTTLFRLIVVSVCLFTAGIVSAVENRSESVPVLERLSAVSGESSITLHWQIDSPQQLRSLKLYRKEYALPVRRRNTTEGEIERGRLIAEPGSDQNEFVDTGVESGYYYYYRLLLSDETNPKGKLSSPVIAAVKDSEPPKEPVIREVKALDEKRFTISWQASASDDVVAYRIYRATRKGQPQVIRIVNLETRKTKTLSEVLQYTGKAESEYRYAIAAVDGAGNVSGKTEYRWLRMPDRIAPRPPSLLQAEQDQDRMVLSWLANRENDLAGYRVYRRDNKAGSSFKPLHKGLLQKTSFVDDRIKPLHAYVYRVAAVDRYGNESRVTRGIVKRTTASGEAVQVPERFRIDRGKNGYPVLSWRSADKRAAMRYIVQRSDGGDFVSISGLIEKSRYVDDSIRDERAYRYRVQAVDTQGQFSVPSKIVLWTGGRK